MRDYAFDLPVYLELDLLNAGWNGTLNPYPGEHVLHAAMRQLRGTIVKKFSDNSNSTADSAALDKFLLINEKCRTYSLKEQHSITEAEAIAIGEAKSWIHRMMFPDGQTGNCLVNFSSISKGFGVGNGANIGVKGTSFLSKVGLSDMSATDPGLQLLLRKAIDDDPLWSDVEVVRQKRRGNAIVQGSRLSFVPKTREISRTICTEPICNMLFQKGIEATLLEGLQRVSGIDLEHQQEKNRELARLGSIDGRFGTIDLTSASDSMSNTLVDEFFPSQVVTWLKRTRSPVTILPDGKVIELHMVSSMGNAFTFPLQTIFFASLVYGAYRVLGLTFDRPFKHSLGNFAVNGDDIIVLREAYDLVVRLLTLCGFSVNVDKSFNTTLFRESCGSDFLQGYNIRGVYVKTLRDENDAYSAINRLNAWSARHGIALPNTIGYLRRGLKTLFVPFDADESSGIMVPLELVEDKIKLDRNGSFIYRYSYIKPDRTFDVSDVESLPPKMDGWFPNHSAVLLAALAGTLRSGQIVNRSFRRSAVLRRKVTPRWEWTSSGACASKSFVDSWKAIYAANLSLAK